MANRDQLVIVFFPIRTREHEMKTAGAKFKAYKQKNIFTYYVNKLCDFLHNNLWNKALHGFKKGLNKSI